MSFHVEVESPIGTLVREHTNLALGAADLLTLTLTYVPGSAPSPYVQTFIGLISDGASGSLTLATADEPEGPFVLHAHEVNGPCWYCDRHRGHLAPAAVHLFDPAL